MSAIQVAIQRCIDAGWYAELRERASFWLGDFPIDPPDLHAEFSRCAMLPKKDDVRLRALQAVWQFPPWGPPWASTHLERAARDPRLSTILRLARALGTKAASLLDQID